MRIVPIFLLVFTTFLHLSFEQNCFDFDSKSSSCHLCSYNSYEASNFNWSSHQFDPLSCTPSSSITTESNTFIDSSRDCESQICNGTQEFPYNDLFVALESIVLVNIKYLNPFVNVFLFGSNPHFLYSNKKISNPLYVFRRMNLTITIQPLFCKILNIFGCFVDNETLIEILIKSSNILFFISQKMILKNLKFDGIDMFAYNEIQDADIKQKSLNFQICSENDLLIQKIDQIKAFCYIQKKLTVFSKNTIYGLFNLEMLYDCQSCSGPKLEIDNCQFFNFLAFNGSEITNSLINILSPSNVEISLQNTSVGKFFLYKGVINVLSDYYYLFVNPFASIDSSIKKWNITIFNCSFSKFNFFQQTFSAESDFSMSLFHLEANKTQKNNLLNLSLNLISNSFFEFYYIPKNGEFYFFTISGFNSSSQIIFEDAIFFSNMGSYLTYFYGLYQKISFSQIKFLNNSEISMYFYSNPVEFYQMTVDFLIVGDESLFQVFETLLNLTDCNFTNIISLNYNPLIKNAVDYHLVQQNKIQSNPYSKTRIFLNRTNFYLMNATLIKTDQMIYQMILHHNNFNSINLLYENLLKLDVDYAFNASHCNFSNIISGYLFAFSYCRNKYFHKINLNNSTTVFFSAKINSIQYNIWAVFDGLVVRNLTLSKINFINLMETWGTYTYSFTTIKNSVFESIDLTTLPFTKIFCLNYQNIIHFENVVLKNVITKDYAFYAENGIFINFTNSVFDKGEIFMNLVSTAFVNNCSFLSSVSNFGTSMVIVNSLFHDNSITSNLFVNDGSLNFFACWDMRYNLILNSTFINNSADIFMENYLPLDFEKQSPEDFAKTPKQICNFVFWAYSLSWFQMTKINDVDVGKSCPDGTVIYFQKDLVFNLSILNEYLRNWSFGYANCTFSNTAKTVFGFKQFTSTPTLFLKNSVVKNLQQNTLVMSNRDCSVYIRESSFVNISGFGAQLGYMVRSHVVFVNLTFENIYLKDQVEGLFYFENSKVTIQNVFCKNITMNKRGFLYGKTSIFNITNLTILEGFSSGGCSALFILKGQINITDSFFYKVNSDNIGAFCLQNVNQTKIINTTIQLGNTGLWIWQGNSNQIYYMSNFSCLNQTGFAGVCFFILEAFVVINESRFLYNKPTSSLIFSTVTNYPCDIKLITIDFSYNEFVISGINIEESNLTVQNASFNNNTFQNLITSSKSLLTMDSVIFFAGQNAINPGRETFSLVNSTLQASNISFEMSLYSLCLEASKNSFLLLNNIVFHKCMIAIRMSDNVFLNISNSTFSENLAFQESGAAISSKDSTIFTFLNIFQQNSIFQDQKNLRGLDIYADNSLDNIINFTIKDSNFTDINGSSVYIRGLFIIEIDNVTYSRILDKPSQALYILNPKSVSIQKYFISNFSGYSAIEIITNYNYQMKLFINASIFINCSSDFSGAALNINGNQIKLTIINSIFQNNRANVHGGAIFYMCSSCASDQYINNMTLKNNSFFKNEANSNGGALKFHSFNFTELLINENKFEKNFALVGNNLAGEVKTLKITNNLSVSTKDDVRNMEKIKQIDGVSGNYSTFLILLFDELDNFLITENVEKIKITPLDDTKLKLLQNIQPIQNGIGNFSTYTYATGFPNDIYTLIISHSKESTVTTSLQLSLRYCKKGENLINFQCVQCGFGYFSLNVNDTCNLCPDVAFCPGRDLLIPVEGYWRFHENSSLIIKCVNIVSCPDQTILYLISPKNYGTLQYNFTKPYEYVCGEGTYGNLCYRCKQNYGPSSKKACIKCGVQFNVIAFIVFNFLILLYQTTTSFEAKDDISRSMMKILINHNNYLALLEVFKGKIYNQNLDSILSFNQQVSVVGTITDATILDCIIQNFFDIEDIIMMRIVVFSFVPLLIIFALALVRFFALILPWIKNKLKEKNKFSIFFSCLVLVIYSFYPKLVNNTFSLLKCIHLDNSNREFLEIDPNIECWGTTHNYYIIRIFVPNLLIWCLGWPIAFGLSLFIKRKHAELSFKKMHEKNMLKSSKNFQPFKTFEDEINSGTVNSIKSLKKTKSIGVDYPKFLLTDNQKDEIFQKNKIYRFLTMEYHFTTYAWDEFFFGSNLLLLAIALQSENMDEVIFAAILMVVFFIMILMTLRFNPFRFQENNKVCTVSYLALLCTFYSVTNLIILERDDRIKEQFYFSLIFVVNAMFYSFWIYYFSMKQWILIKRLVFSFLKTKKTNKKSQKEK